MCRLDILYNIYTMLKTRCVNNINVINWSIYKNRLTKNDKKKMTYGITMGYLPN